MTLLHKEWISCPECLHEEEVTIWDRISIQEDPDLKEEILLKKLQLFHCNQCQAEYILDKPYVYLDETKKIVFIYAPKFTSFFKDTDEEKINIFNQDIIRDYKKKFKFIEHLRLCLNYNDLIEKIHLADHNFDDRLMEIIKLAIKSRIKDEEGKGIEKLYFLSGDSQRMIFQAQYLNNTLENLEFSTDLYLNAENTLADKIAEENILVVDEIYALNFIKRSK